MSDLANIGLTIDFSSTLTNSSVALGLEGNRSTQTHDNFKGCGSNISEIVRREAQERDFYCDNLIPIPHIFSSKGNISPKIENSSEDIIGKASEIVNPGAADWNPVNTIKASLSEATSIAIDNLIEFRDSSDFFETSKIAFGEKITLNELTGAVENIISREADINLEVVNRNTPLNSGAFAAETNTIYFSKKFLNQNKNNPENIANVLLEELGHYLDHVLNDTDSAGDEGEIFVDLVKGFNFDLNALKAENDHANLRINGNNVMIEQAAFGTINLPTSWVVFKSDRGSILAFKRDGRVSALTDIYFAPSGGLVQRYENVKAPINFFNGQFSIVTRVSNTTTVIKPDGTIGFGSGFIRPRLTVNAPRWTRIQ
jgi:hypothetical protein